MRRGAAIVLAVVATACAPSDPLPGYRPASAEDRASVIAVIDEYYALLSRAEVTGDTGALLARHPGLASGQQRQRGINIETWTVERTVALKLSEVKIDVASYEPVRVYMKDAAAAAYVHGIFTWEYAQGGSPTKGELAVRIDLIQTPGGWSIERTDEWVLGETPPPSPRR
jgi:hypothetical protein